MSDGDNGTCLLSETTVLLARQPIGCLFKPQPDITAYELARLMPYMAAHPAALYEEDWERLGPTVTRHLERTP